MPLIDVIIPAFNEEHAVGKVVRDIPRAWVRDVVVCDNNSTDATAEIARQSGATVVSQPLPGYGNACLKGIEYLCNKPEKPEIVVFLDGDYSDYPEQLPAVVAPIVEGRADLVIGSRTLGQSEKGSLMPQQVFGNRLATALIRTFFRYRFTDLGPFRAIRFDKLLSLEMCDRNYGWTVEMQVKAAKMGLACCEVPVDYRQRIGQSKVSGTLRGSFLAGQKILWTIFRYL
jgi:glycosyltransferase involved in cell wall biosynthesis